MTAPQDGELKTRIRRPPRASVALAYVARNLQPQAARKELWRLQGALGSPPRRATRAASAAHEPRQRSQHSNSNRTRNGPNERTSRSTASDPGTPRRGKFCLRLACQWFVKYLSLVRSAAPEAAGGGFCRANASSCDWWARRARSGHGRALEAPTAAAGCPAARRSNKRCARGRGAAQGIA